MNPRVALLLFLSSTALAQTYYVNNQAGSDANDGRSGKTAFATIARAVKAARTSDTIVLANTGTPYREAIPLRGLGGTPAKPFVIEGNGATITGLKPLPAASWKQEGNGIWLFPVERKPYGNPFLVHAGRRLTPAKSAETIEVGQFLWDDEGIRFRPEAGKSIADTPLEATLIDSGVAIGGASYIVCRNLVSEFHSNDGFNIHGDCRGVVFENIEARHNGDDGFSIHEFGGAVVRNAFLHHNRWGIQDVNASRSVFNGVTCAHNEANGADFVGGYHSLVDCVIRDNGKAQVNIRGEQPKHLVGGRHDPLCEAVCFLQNVVTSGGPESLRVGGRARVTARHCAFVGAQVGVVVRGQATCHVSASVVQAAKWALDSTVGNCFRDANVYTPGRFRWLGKELDWTAFRSMAGHDEHSVVGEVGVTSNGAWRLALDEAMAKRRPRPGPTHSVLGHKEGGR